MEKLTSLINNFNTDCHKQYTNVSPLLGDMLNDILLDIEKFYYSDFWYQRYKTRLEEEHITFNRIKLDIIHGVTSELKDNTKFKLYDEDQSSNGLSDNKTMIALNVNMNKEKLNDSHIKNLVMHEFGHRQYNQKEFQQII